MIIQYRIIVNDKNEDFEEFDSYSDIFEDALAELAEYLENYEPITYEIKKGLKGRKIYLYELWVREEVEYYGEYNKVKEK